MDEAKANVSLIAAAPEMLEILRDWLLIRDMMKAGRIVKTSAFDDAAKWSRAVLDRVEGGEG